MNNISVKLKHLGYTEVKPNLYYKLCIGYCIYHDYRKGRRWSYGFDEHGSIDISCKREYREVVLLEEADKCRTLDKFDGDDRK